MAQPFFSIGVPTYNRHSLLRETIVSILAQEFTDFEVIVGNDYTAETLTGELIGISDPRIRFVNHPQNLREVGNMNRLIELAEGRYFTWLFDDDLLEPYCLAIAHETITATDHPDAFFPSFRTIHGNEPFQPLRKTKSAVEILSGKEFLNRYDPLRPTIISTSGFFELTALHTRLHGVKELCASAIGLNCEYLFLARCTLLSRIAFMNTPLVVFRVHDDSWGESNIELEKYHEAGVNLLEECATVLSHTLPKLELPDSLMKICKIHLYSYATKSAKFELAGKRTGLSAAMMALGRYFRESAKIRAGYARLTDTAGYGSFFGFNIYCCRLILFKMRSYRPPCGDQR